MRLFALPSATARSVAANQAAGNAIVVRVVVLLISRSNMLPINDD
nr:hypothetical protein [Chamaesiphon sp. GL140_3_metabinner_50]